MGIEVHIPTVEHGAGWNSGALQPFHGLDLVEAAHPARNDLVDFIVMCATRCFRRKTLVRCKLGPIDHLAQRGPLLVIAHAERTPRIFARTAVSTLWGKLAVAVTDPIALSAVRDGIEHEIRYVEAAEL